MRVAVTGTACVGKSTFVKDFLNNWDGIYTKPDVSYRDMLEERKLNHSKNTTKETQQAILDYMVDQHMKYSKDDCVIFDRCPIDNLVYSLYSYDKGLSDIDEEFIESCIPIIKESMRFLDIVLYIPKLGDVQIEENGTRETDPEFIEEIDKMLIQIEHQALQPSSAFFHTDDRPAFIRITGEPRERIRQASLYITDDGGSYTEQESEIDWEELASMGIQPEDVFPGGRL